MLLFWVYESQWFSFYLWSQGTNSRFFKSDWLIEQNVN